jgi:arylformamidase
MRIVDLSHYLEAGMPLFPGTAAPRFEETTEIARDGFREKRISLCVHTGTHIDAPAHILAGGQTLDQLPAETFYGPAVLMDCTADGRKTIDLSDLRRLGEAVCGCDFLLFRTDWSRYWGHDRYFSGFPVITPQAARCMVDVGLKGVGLDTLSVDPPDSVELPVHHIILEAGLVIVENLNNLDALPSGNFNFSCLPLKIRNADGSPVRAVALVP